jgi:SulP family sulfate permease
VSGLRRSERLPSSIAAGVIIGVVEVILVISFATLVFGGRIVGHLADGIGVYLVAAVPTLAILAWRAGPRGVVGSVQDATAAVFAIVAATTALSAFGSPQRAFLTVIAATLVVTVLCGVVFLLLGTLRRGNVIRFVPYPVVGGLLAGIGWLLLKGGIAITSGVQPTLHTVGDLLGREPLVRWGPALAFGVLMLLAVRVLKRPLVIPAALAAGVAAFVIVMLLTGSSLEEARQGKWLLGPFRSARLWEPWTLRAITGADWWTVLEQGLGIVAAVFVAAIAALFNIGETERILGRDLDTNEELRDAGSLNFVSGALGGIPGYHALGFASLANRMNVDARTAGLVAAAVLLASVLFGASLIAVIPRVIVGGVLAFLGATFLVEWVWDRRRSLPTIEYIVALLILAGVIAHGFLPGVVLGLVLAVVLFAISYSRVELVREAPFGDAYRSNVDRPPAERAALRTVGALVQVLRVHGFVFFGSADNLLERIRRRVEAGPFRFLLIDLQRVSGVDSSAVASFVKVVALAQAGGFDLVFTGASEPVRKQLARGGVAELSGVVAFEPDLDRGLQRAEDALLEETNLDSDAAAGPGDALDAMPPSLRSHLESVALDEGAVLIRQDDPPEDVFVLESGRLRAETHTSDGRGMRLRTMLPGVVVGEVAMYAGTARTADVVAEIPSVVLRLSRRSIERIAVEDPALAAALHRWLATTLAERLDDTLRSVDARLS